MMAAIGKEGLRRSNVNNSTIPSTRATGKTLLFWMALP